MVEAALVLCVISEELVTAMLFTITLVEATAGSGGAKTEHEDVITSAVVVGPVDTGNRVQDVSPSPTLQEGPQEELMSVRSVMAKETCAVKRKKKCTYFERVGYKKHYLASKQNRRARGREEGVHELLKSDMIKMHCYASYPTWL